MVQLLPDESLVRLLDLPRHPILRFAALISVCVVAISAAACHVAPQ